MYSFKFDHPVFEAYPKFKIFLNERLEKLRSDGYLDSILGRRFYISGDRKELSVFNAQFQGSVAHMMQIALIRLYKLFPEFVFTEMHDSIVMSCNLADIKRIMNESLDIMVNPIDDYIMPVKVSVGRRWKRWKGCKEKRN
jgi:DNA polymerase-1